MFTCFICQQTVLDLSCFKSHIDENHHDISLQRWYCPVKDCNRFLSVKKSYLKHLSTHKTDQSNIDPICEVNRDVTHEVVEPRHLLHENDESEDAESLLNETKFSFLKMVISILSDMSISRTTALKIIKKSFSHSTTIVDKIQKINQKNLIFYSEEDILQLNELYDYASNSIPSQYMIFKDIKKYKVHVPTIMHPLNVEGTLNYDEKGDPLLNETVYTLQLVVLRDLFHKLCNIKSFFELILDFINTLDCNDDNVANIMQAPLWKSKVATLNKERTLHLPLLVYFDDLETLNALGSKSGLYKVGAVYVKLMCLPPNIQSQLLYTHLAMLFFTDDRKDFGDKVVFSKLIEELNYLQDVGIKVCHEKYDTVKIISIIICGDNLGLNGILSFTECFVANFWCRFCLFHNNTMKTLTMKDNEAMHRNKENYEAQVIINNLSLTGIRENSIFNNLHNFHVTFNLCVDLAHDFLEGVLHTVMTRIINNLIHKHQWFSLNQLNAKINTFNRSLKSANKIGIITEEMLSKNKIKSSAIEMLNFFETFPFIISGLIADEMIKEWLLYLILRDILSILMSDTINEKEIQLITLLINEFNELYLDCLASSLKAKHHLMCHYPLVLRNIGPILQVWTLRFESFHQIFKQTAKMSRSRINLLKTFAIKNELINANLLLNNDFQLITQIKGKESPVHSNITNKYDFNFENVSKISFLKINNLKYKNGVCVQLNNKQLPTFALINEVFVLNNEILFGCQVLQTNGFNRTYYGFSINYGDSFQIIPLNSLFQSHTLYSIHRCEEQNILLRIR